jgi:hypothetical protein
MSKTSASEPDGLLETLTARAVEAAEGGRWDVVQACYQQRARVLADAQQPACAARLSAMDQRVAERARLVQAVVAHALADVSAMRHRLEWIRKQADSDPDGRGARVDQQA